MNYIYSAIFGIIQGVTEFLPISSSGHLVILHKFITLPVRNELAFDVALHLATLLAVLWYFRQEVKQLLKSWIRSFSGSHDQFSKISWLIILGTMPAALAGWLFDDFIEVVFRSPLIVAVMLVLIGILFIVFEKISRFAKDLEKLTWRQVLLIGLAQAVALIPGTSRSGITIIAGLGAGLKRDAAVRFSFLLSIPVIAGAAIKKMPPAFNLNQAGEELAILFIAFIFSYLSGYLSIKYFLQFAKRHSLNIFAVYRFILAAVILFYFL